MPLRQGSSRDAIAANIRTERAAGKPQRQAVAIALHTADRSRDDRARHPQHHTRTIHEHAMRGLRSAVYRK